MLQSREGEKEEKGGMNDIHDSPKWKVHLVKKFFCHRSSSCCSFTFP